MPLFIQGTWTCLQQCALLDSYKYVPSGVELLISKTFHLNMLQNGGTPTFPLNNANNMTPDVVADTQ